MSAPACDRRTLDPVMCDQVFTREELSAEQRLFGTTAEQFMRREVLPQQTRLAAHDWSLARQLLRAAGGLDLLRIEIPVAYGGLGLDKASAAAVAEQTSLSASFAVTMAAHAGIGTLPLVFFGNEDQKRRYLPRLGSGELVAAFALTEPESGSDAMAVRTTATRSADGTQYVLSGRKAWITNGGFADLFTVFAKVDGTQLTAFLVERSMGVASGAEERKLGLDGSSTTALTMDAVAVPAGNVLGAVGRGAAVARCTLTTGRAKLGVRNMSWSKHALSCAVEYARLRRQFGRPIAEFSLTQRKLAEMAAICYAGESMAYRVIGDLDRAVDALGQQDSTDQLAAVERLALECSATKVWTSEALGHVVDEALQLHGANGYAQDAAVNVAYRDARVTRIFEGTNEINRLLIARRLRAQPPESPASDDRVPAETTDDVLAAGQHVLRVVRRVLCIALRTATDLCGETLDERQDLLVSLADLAIEAYAIESVIARTAKFAMRADEQTAALARDAAWIYLVQSLDRLTRSVRFTEATLKALGSRNRQVLARRFVTFDCTPAVAARERLAAATLARAGYPL